MNWQTPIPVRSVRLWSVDPSQPRRASWLELFFDLIFVAAVAQLGVPLGEDYIPPERYGDYDFLAP